MKKQLIAALALIPLSLWADVIRVEVSFSNPEVAFENGVAQFKGDYFPSESGAPLLPLVRKRVLLPNGVDENSIVVTLDNSRRVTLPGKYSVAKVGADYDSENSYLSDQYRSISEHLYSSRIGRYRQFTFLELLLSPLQLDTLDNTITSISSSSIKIEFDRNESRSSITPTERSRNKVSEMVDNDSALETYGLARRAAGSHLAIITTSDAVANLTELNSFIQSKETRGFKTSVITEDVWGGGIGDASADNLHNWLRENYLQEEIDYLLIIGDPSPATGDIAMKVAHAYYSGKKAATDFYFSDITGDWDADGDGKYGEIDDVKKSGGIDAIPDIVVGRIPLYSRDYSSVDHILRKTINYETASSADIAWRDNILLAMDGYYGGEGYEVGESIHDDLAGSSWDFYRMYSRNVGGCDEFSITEQGVTSAWTARGHGVVSWLTHGKEDAAMHIMNNSYARQLDDDYPSFVLMGSCLNGKPDVKNNLAYTILKNGAIGVVAGSETTIFRQPMGNLPGSSYNHGFIRDFTINIANNKPFVGDVLSDTKENADMGCWKNYCAFNLYGDPTIGLAVADVPTALEKTTAVSGVKHLQISSVGNQLNISGVKSGDISVNIYSLQGKLLFKESRVITDNSGIQLSLDNLAKGAYVAQVKMNNRTVSNQFIKGI